MHYVDQSEAASNTMRHVLSLPLILFPFAVDHWKRGCVSNHHCVDNLPCPWLRLPASPNSETYLKAEGTIKEARFRMNGEGGEEVEGRLLEKRAHIQVLYAQVHVSNPSLPPLREFQVAGITARHIPHLTTTTTWSLSISSGLPCIRGWQGGHKIKPSKMEVAPQGCLNVINQKTKNKINWVKIDIME